MIAQPQGMSSILAITVAMAAGFTGVLIAAGLVYAIGLCAAPLAAPSAERSSPA